MNINEFCGIVVVASLLLAVTMFIVLIVKINRPPRPSLSKQVTVDVLGRRTLLTTVDSQE